MRSLFAVLLGVASLSVVDGGEAAEHPAAKLAATRLYDNTGNPANTYYASQGGAEAIDDVHLASGGTLDSLVFEYYDPTPGAPFAATASLYRNPGGLDLGTSAFAGPFEVTGLTPGRGIVAIRLPPGLAADRDLWVGVRFTSATAGLIVNSLPSVGSSHDLYLENGGFYWFDGNPRANFGLRLVGSSTTLEVDPVPPAAGVALAPAHPNPFRRETTLRFSLPNRSRVQLGVFDASGRRVRMLVDGVLDAGDHAERWSGRDDSDRLAPPGVYFVRLETPPAAAIRSVVLMP